MPEPFSRTSRLLIVLAALVAGRPAAAALAPGDSARTLAVGGVERRYLLHVPTTYDDTAPVPLVLDLHDAGATPESQRAASGWADVADRVGFLLAYPEATAAAAGTLAWNAGACCNDTGVDDVAFVRAVIADVAAAGNVDPKRIYVSGWSNGGAMAHRLACDAADVIASATPIAFPIATAPLAACAPQRPIPVLTVMGLSDQVVPYDGGAFPSAVATFDYWHDIDGCRGDSPDVTERAGGSRCETYTHCADGALVCLCSVRGTAFPGEPIDGHLLYENDDHVDLANVGWNFMTQFRLPTPRNPIRATVRGQQTLVMRGAHADTQALAWDVVLNDETWSATDGAGLFLSGTAKRTGRRYALTVTSAAQGALLASLSSRAATLLGTPSVSLTSAGATKLAARTDKRGGVRLAARVRLAVRGGAKLTLKLGLRS